MNFGLLPNLPPQRQQPASLLQLRYFSISFGALASASTPQYFSISILASEFPFAKGRNIPLCKVTTFFRLSRPLTYIYASPASISFTIPAIYIKIPPRRLRRNFLGGIVLFSLRQLLTRLQLLKGAVVGSFNHCLACVEVNFYTTVLLATCSSVVACYGVRFAVTLNGLDLR